jgi:hypothetical protein
MPTFGRPHPRSNAVYSVISPEIITVFLAELAKSP